MKKIHFPRVLAIDVETTGLHYKKDSILEIGAVLYCTRTGKKDVFSILVNHPTLESRFGAEAAKQAISLEEAIFIFSEILESNILYTGYNIRFDYQFLNYELDKRKLNLVEVNRTWCSYNFFRRQKKVQNIKTKKSNLEAALEFYKLKKIKPFHRALPDAENAMNLYLKQVKVLQTQKVNFFH